MADDAGGACAGHLRLAPEAPGDAYGCKAGMARREHVHVAVADVPGAGPVRAELAEHGEGRGGIGLEGHALASAVDGMEASGEEDLKFYSEATLKEMIELYGKS